MAKLLKEKSQNYFTIIWKLQWNYTTVTMEEQLSSNIIFWFTKDINEPVKKKNCIIVYNWGFEGFLIESLMSLFLQKLPFKIAIFLVYFASMQTAAWLPWCLSWERIFLQCGRPVFDPWVGQIPWRRGHGHPLQYSCLKNSRGQRSLAGYSPWGHKESDSTEWLSLSNSSKTVSFCGTLQQADYQSIKKF